LVVLVQVRGAAHWPVPAPVPAASLIHPSDPEFIQNSSAPSLTAAPSPTIGLFWRIAKKSDWQSIDSFDAEFDELRKLVDAEKHERNESIVAKCLEWLDSLYEKLKNWAARWTHRHFTFGADATSRGESLNSGKGARGRSLPARP
jgi:hypothetical protein